MITTLSWNEGTCWSTPLTAHQKIQTRSWLTVQTTRKAGFLVFGAHRKFFCKSFSQQRQILPVTYQLSVTPWEWHRGPHWTSLYKQEKIERKCCLGWLHTWTFISHAEEYLVSQGPPETCSCRQVCIPRRTITMKRSSLHKSNAFHLPLPGPELGLPRTLPCADRDISICNFKCSKLSSSVLSAGVDKEGKVQRSL